MFDTIAKEIKWGRKVNEGFDASCTNNVACDQLARDRNLLR